MVSIEKIFTKYLKASADKKKKKKKKKKELNGDDSPYRKKSQ